MKYILVSVILAALLSTQCKAPNSKATTQQTVPKISIESKLQVIVDSMYQAFPATKGIAVHVESPDLKISWTYATGWADSATKRTLKPNDPALIASITKMYLSATILRLVEQGNIQLNEPILELLPDDRLAQLIFAGYDVKNITVAHLNSQTSGIYDFVNTDTYQNRTNAEPNHVWTRDEQIILALENPPAFSPGDKFEYSETNNLLLTEVLEIQTGLPFYEAMRKILNYDNHGLNNTWFNWLEGSSEDAPVLAHQFATEYMVDSYSMHASFDVYGGGGIASTTLDVAKFTQLLFTGKLFEDPETKELLYQTIRTADSLQNNYFMGIAKTAVGKYIAFGHGGFWGTTTQYFPELNASVSIFLMERDQWPKYMEMLEQIALVLDAEK